MSEIPQHAQDDRGIRPSQPERHVLFGQLISFCDLVPYLVDERKAVDVVYFDISKAFHSVSYSFSL